MLNSSDLKVGRIFQDSGQPFKVEKYSHSKVARSGATIKIRARNIITGELKEFTYSGNAKIEEADTLRRSVQYLYNDGTNYYFMNPETFEQFDMTAESLGDDVMYLIEGDSVQVLLFDGKPVSIELPISLIYEIAYTEPGYKGNTVTNVYKEAELTNGLKVKVPMFMKIGEKVKIDTRTGEYMSKA